MPAYSRARIPQAKRSFCCFVDILGFKAMTALAATQGTQQSLLDRLSKGLELSAQFQDRKNPLSKRIWGHKFFTDCLVLGCPFDYAPFWADPAMDGESELGNLISLCASHQLALAFNGFAVRGGIDVGLLHIGSDIVFGSALIGAYELESNREIPRSPRIVLDDFVVSLFLGRHLNAYKYDPDEMETGIPGSPQNEELLVDDEDSRVFVNYLSWLSSLVRPFQGLEKHKHFIEDGLEMTAGKKDIHDKFRWLATYHNFFCSHFILEVDEELVAIPAKYKVKARVWRKNSFHRLSDDAAMKRMYLRQTWMNLEPPRPTRPER